MNQYELMVLLSPELGAQGTKKRLDSIRKLITSNKGEIFYEDDWGLRDMAYRIKKHDRGYYMVINFNLDPTEGDLDEIDTTCRLENEILRHMITRVPAGIEPKSYANMEEDDEDDIFGNSEETEETTKKASKPKAKKSTTKAEKPSTGKKEAKAAKEEKGDKEPSLEDVDAKLKSIIDNPDLNF
ncbi:MAG TPA: 30S ribosomal protein S6 [Candidatus Gracilibacteria bacterium]|nr:30S ribosomal protein S6 [Candidatus Gracilibacteria bacterium]